MVTDTQLLEQAAALHEEANRLLIAEGLLPIITTAGPARVYGSFELDLMTWRDIDINLQLANPHDVATMFTVGQSIATRFEANRMFYSNHFIRNDQSFDHGLYWGMRLRYAGALWKVDLWAYGEEAYRAHMQSFDELQQQLATADRIAILRIKDAFCRRSEYRDTVCSMDIYRAVMEHNISTVEGFEAWLRLRS